MTAVAITTVAEVITTIMSDMRKASREMDAAFAFEVFDKAPYITVSFTRPDGSPYGVPLSLARKDEKTFYFHGALEGDKMDCIANNPKVALSAVSRCTPTVSSLGTDPNHQRRIRAGSGGGSADHFFFDFLLI